MFIQIDWRDMTGEKNIQTFLHRISSTAWEEHCHLQLCPRLVTTHMISRYINTLVGGCYCCYITWYRNNHLNLHVRVGFNRIGSSVLSTKCSLCVYSHQQWECVCKCYLAISWAAHSALQLVSWPISSAVWVSESQHCHRHLSFVVAERC